MENYRNLYHQSILTVRKLILEAKYYRYYRAEWEEDISDGKLYAAQMNLKQAELYLKHI